MAGSGLLRFTVDEHEAKGLAERLATANQKIAVIEDSAATGNLGEGVGAEKGGKSAKGASTEGTVTAVNQSTT
jgi:hypothetical protein